MQGYTRSHIVQHGSKWKISSRQIDDYIHQATNIIKEVNLTTLQDNQGVVISQLWSLFREAREAKNLPEQHKLILSIAKFKGLDQVTINHVIEDKREMADMTDEELDAILEAGENVSH